VSRGIARAAARTGKGIAMDEEPDIGREVIGWCEVADLYTEAY
jgi:hypothetical protein